MSEEDDRAADRDAAAERFRRIARFNILLLLVLGPLGIAVALIYLGLTWLVVALMILLPLNVLYLAYLMRRLKR